MKQRVRVVIVENERLHEEVKSKVVEESLKEQPISDGTVSAETAPKVTFANSFLHMVVSYRGTTFS